jgi:hypothetical protein
MLARRAPCGACRSEFAVRILGHIWRAALVLALVAGATSPRSASAAGVAVVVVQSTGASPDLAETVSRLRGELLSLGVAVVMAERPAERTSGASDPRTWLPRDAVAVDPVAVIETVTDGAPAVDIWIFHERRQAPEVLRVALEPNVENGPGRLAIHAVEVLRSNLLVIDLAARGKARDPAAVTRAGPGAGVAPEAPARAPASRVGLSVGAGVLTGLDGVGPALLPLGRFEWVPRRWLTLQATGSGFGTRPTINAAAGSARVSQQYGTLGICLCAPGDHPLGLQLSLSAGALRTAIDATADAPAEAHAVRRWSLLADASVGARVRLPGRYYLTAAAHLQLAEPYVAIHFVDKRVATSGRPNLLVSITVGAWL